MLPTPGTPSFLPLLIAHLHDPPSLAGWNFDPTLLSVLLIALIVRRGGVIIDVERDGSSGSKEGVKKVVKVVQAMSESMFGKSTHHLKLSPSSEPLDVSHSLLSDPTTPHQSSKSNRKSAASSRYTSANSLPALSPHSLNPDQPADIKLPDLLVVSGLENAQSPAQIKLLSIVHSSRLEYDDSTYEAPEGWMSIWVRDADGPEVPSWVVDHFSCSMGVYPDDLELPPSGLHRETLIPPQYLTNLTSLLTYTHIHPPLQIQISNLLTAISLHSKLQSTITSKAVLTFPQLVRAHRLLSAPFSLPVNWEEGLKRVRDVQAGGEGERFGMGGGRGGVDTWGLKAGEAPDVRGLRGKLRRGGSDTGEGDAEGREDGEDWYAGLRDVEGAWGVGVRHRVRWRKEGGEVMWLLDGSAADLGRKGYEGERMAKGRKGKRGGRDVDGLLEEILRTV